MLLDCMELLALHRNNKYRVAPDTAFIVLTH
jgi:hypothetical protein